MEETRGIEEKIKKKKLLWTPAGIGKNFTSFYIFNRDAFVDVLFFINFA